MVYVFPDSHLFFRITDPTQRENLGIIVQYKVKVKLCLGPLGGDVVAELPFILMHPKPEDPDYRDPKEKAESNHANDAKDGNNACNSNNAMDTNLIQLDE